LLLFVVDVWTEGGGIRGGELAEDGDGDVDGLSDLGWGKQRRFVLTGVREDGSGI